VTKLPRCRQILHATLNCPLVIPLSLEASSRIKNARPNEVETHTGLILKSGHDRFEFSHKSLQEYLAAEFTVKMPSKPSNMIDLQIMPNELAIATAILAYPIFCTS
jgi:hypothetical protein